ncbi:polysaccharide deacetylase family protein [Henriciella aquimarina]|uniref:polysaccharide deacetylase family protein n=1 Tax=Henriciella aquimarina TaxID=545261 RepID=UPI000A0058A5|nr:polysaccharide deacetylase family protein [Henriciella aquimarina]
MGVWGPQNKDGAFIFTFDNLGEPGEIEQGVWPKDEPFGNHPSVFKTLPFILDVLRRNDFKTTFFVEGWTADRYPDAVESIAKDGHEVACHAYCHETWYRLSESDQEALLTKATKAFTKIGIQPTGFRMPGAISSEFAEKLALSMGYRYVSPVGGVAGTRNGLGIIPVALKAVDIAYYLPVVAGHFAHPDVDPDAPDWERMIDGFRRTREDTLAAKDCQSLTCHVTTPLNTPEREAAFEKLVVDLKSDERVWSPTMGEAAEWMLAQPEKFPTPEMRKFGDDFDPTAMNDTFREKAADSLRQ